MLSTAACLFGLFFSTFLALISASDVLEFTDANFDAKIKDHDVILVEFYAPWCGHCKRLAPEYEKAATKLVANDPPIHIAKVDCTAEKSVCDKFGVSGFPTLKIFRHGELSQDYDGPREADGIIKYMRGQVGPSTKELKTLAEFDKFIAVDEFSVLGFFEKDTKLKDSYTKVADTERDKYRFAHTTAKDILDKVGFTDDIVVYRPKNLNNKFEDNHVRYDGNFDSEKIRKFLTNKIQGLCGYRTMENIGNFEKPLVVVYYNVDYVKDPKGTNYWRNRVLKVASGLAKKKIHFAISSRSDFSAELEEFGLGDQKDSEKPSVAGHGENGEKFPMKDREFSIEALQEFSQHLLDGKLTPYMKSEEVPTKNDGPVKVVVAKNFKQIVDQDKDVLVEFYAPWCGHCKKLTPIFDELGEKLAKENVVIAKMDATANDVPPLYKVSGFPTLYWVPKGKKTSPVPYSGGRELDDFIKFIAKESTEPLNGYDRNGKKAKKDKKKEL